MLQTSRTQKEAGDLLGTYMLQGWVITEKETSFNKTMILI